MNTFLDIKFTGQSPSCAREGKLLGSTRVSDADSPLGRLVSPCPLAGEVVFDHQSIERSCLTINLTINQGQGGGGGEVPRVHRRVFRSWSAERGTPRRKVESEISFSRFLSPYSRFPHFFRSNSLFLSTSSRLVRGKRDPPATGRVQK